MDINTLLQNKISNNTLLTKNELLDIIEWYINLNNIDIETIVLGTVPSIDKSEGGYVPETNYLYLDFNTIIENRLNKINLLNEYLGKEYKYQNIYLNMELLITIIHELTHAIQNQKDNLDNSINILIKKTIEYSKSNYDGYLQLYRFMPFEKEACINSYSTVTNLFKLNGADLDIINYHKQVELSALLSNYIILNKIILSSLEILNKKNIITDEEYKLIKLNPNLDLYTRLKYGISVRIEDYYKVYNLYNQNLNYDSNVKELILHE